VPLVLFSNKKDLKQDKNIYPLDSRMNLNGAVEIIIDNSDRENFIGFNYFCKSVNKTFKEFCKRYKYIEAAGGLVMNDKGKVLMIHRLGVWDLPKGKLDKGETPRKAAIREVEEECGIGKLKIIKSLPPTYHIYTLNGKRILKKTFWFKMISTDSKKPIPQTEENIDEVCWMSKTKMKRLNPKNTYRSILDVLSNLSDNNSVGKK